MEESSAKIQKLLECPICLETNFKPKMLPCQHTFCLKCSREMTFKEIIGRGRFRYIVMEIKCALCRKWYDLTNRGPDGLANNLTLVQLLALTGHDHQHYPSCFSMVPKNDIRQGKNQWAKSSGLLLFRNKGFLVNKMFQQNTLKFAYIYVQEKPYKMTYECHSL